MQMILPRNFDLSDLNFSNFEADDLIDISKLYK